MLLALALARLPVAVAAAVLAANMIVIGLAPAAELEGIFVPLGEMLAVGVLIYGAAAVRSVVQAARRNPRSRITLQALAVVDGCVAMSLLLAVSVSGRPERSPGWVGIFPLVLCVTTFVAVRSGRRSVVPSDR